MTRRFPAMNTAFIPDPRHPNWKASSCVIKQMLMLPKKLPPAPAEPRQIGHLISADGRRLAIWDLPQVKGRKCHRLYADVNGRMVPVGRLHQIKE